MSNTSNAAVRRRKRGQFNLDAVFRANKINVESRVFQRAMRCYHQNETSRYITHTFDFINVPRGESTWRYESMQACGTVLLMHQYGKKILPVHLIAFNRFMKEKVYDRFIGDDAQRDEINLVIRNTEVSQLISKEKFQQFWAEFVEEEKLEGVLDPWASDGDHRPMDAPLQEDSLILDSLPEDSQIFLTRPGKLLHIENWKVRASKHFSV
jgi:hypothetical protein